MSELELKIKRGKNANRQAKARIRKKIIKTTEYQAVSPATQKRLLKEAEIKMMDKRYIAINIAISV
jgi:predicted outer membrane protein